MHQHDMKTEYQYWKTLTDAARILYYHSNQIQRHEAAFVLGQFPYRSEVEQVSAIYFLRKAMRYDPSIVARHEMTEALGETFCVASIGAAADLAKILAFKLDHDDILKTAEEAFEWRS